MSLARTVPARLAEVVNLAAADHAMSEPSRGLYVGSAGNIKVDMAGGGSPVTFIGVPAGTLLPIEVARVYKVGTTASAMIALF